MESIQAGDELTCATWLAAGNLLVLKDGRVGFIDFGIVGSISPVTWAAVESLVRSAASNDFDLMARSLITMGMTDQEVDIPVRQTSAWPTPYLS